MNYVITTGRSVDEAVEDALKKLKLKKEDVTVEVLQEASKGFLGFGQKDAAVKVSKKEDTEDILKEIFSEEFESEKSKSSKFENKTRNKVKSEPKFSKSEELSNDKAEVTEEVKAEVHEIKSCDTSKTLDEEVETEDSENIEEAEANFDIEKFTEISNEFIDKILKPLEIKYDTDITMDKNVLNVNILGNEKDLGIVIGKRGTTLDSIQYILSLIINKHSDSFVRVIVDSSGYREKRKNTLISLAEKTANRALRTGRPAKLEPMNAHERKIIHEALKDFEGVFTHSEGQEPNRRIVVQIKKEYWDNFYIPWIYLGNFFIFFYIFLMFFLIFFRYFFHILKFYIVDNLPFIW